MPRLLIYYPSNKRTVALQSLIIALRKTGVEVLFLSQCEKGELHEFLEQHNIPIFETQYDNNGFFGFIKQAYRLISFCHQNKITTVHSHLQEANKVSVLCQYLIPSRVVIFRHHFNYHQNPNSRRNQKEVIGEKLINLLGKEIIVPSFGVYNSILKSEYINKRKLSVVPYLYDFSQYTLPKAKKKDGEFRIVICSRFIKAKRHIVLFEALEKLTKLGYTDFTCYVLDDGPEKNNLINYVKQSSLNGKVVFTGHIPDIMEELNNCDILIHPSVYDASNSVVKEAGLLKKPVMVCKGVGDFDEYIVHNKNGIIIDPFNTKKDIIRNLQLIFANKIDIKSLGENLKITVIEKFSVSVKNVNKYLNLIS